MGNVERGARDRNGASRALLDLIAAETGDGVVGDLGSGPGHVAAYLAARGARALAIDLSPAMVEQARTRGVEARVGDLRALLLDDGALRAAVALYAIVHLSVDELRAFARELARVLDLGAPALVSFHVGTDPVRVEEFLGATVDLTFSFFETAQVADALAAAGLTVEMRLERAPYVPHEHPSTRGYLWVRRQA